MRRFRSSCEAVSLIISGIGIIQPSPAQVPMEKVVVTGDVVPGTPDGTIFGPASTNVFPGFGVPQIDLDGRITFSARLDGPGVVHSDADTEVQGDDSGVWYGTPTSLALVARAGGQTPGTSGGLMYDDLYPMYPTGNTLYNGAGGVVLQARLRGEGVTTENNTAIWSGTPEHMELLARTGESAPGSPANIGLFSFGMYGPLSNQTGDAAFLAAWMDTSQPNYHRTLAGIWSGSPGKVQEVARELEPAPSPVQGAVFSIIGGVAMNNQGQLCFAANQIAPGLTDSNNGAVWLGRPGQLSVVVREGDPTPDSRPGSTFGPVYSVRLNDTGQIAFRDFAPDEASGGITRIWAGEPGRLALVAQEGEQAPGLPSGTAFAYLIEPTLNGQGDVAFVGLFTDSLTHRSERGLWSDVTGSLSLIVRTGESAPGTPDGGVLTLIDSNVIMNGRGQLVFDGQYRLPGEPTDAAGIWAFDPADGVMLVARVGQFMEVAPGDVRVISALNLAVGSGGEDGLPMSLSDSGRLVFWTGFTDGTEGIFMARVPEPSALLLVACAWLALIRRQRGHPN